MAWRRVALRVHRVLVRAHPAEFRQEYGEEMDRVASERFRSEPFSQFCRDVIRDAAASAPREHLHILARDLRHAIRLFAKTRAFTLAIILALTLGVGGATTIFTLINTVLIRALPLGAADRLVYLWTPLPRYERLPRELGPSYADVLAWEHSSHSFESITAFGERMLNVSAAGDPVRVGGAFVLENFFQTLQARPLLGRALDASDESAGGVAVISENLWQALWNRDPGVVGRLVAFDNTRYRVVGVMPSEFTFPHENDFPSAVKGLKRTDIWIPARLTPGQRADRLFTADAAVGRLLPGVTREEAQAEMAAIEAQLDKLNLPEMQGAQSLLEPLTETAVGPVRPLMRLLMGAVVLVLLIACGNVANLLIARVIERNHEIGVRLALGASRARLVRQLMTESVLISLVGGTAGSLASVLALRVLTRMDPGDIPRFEQMSVDGHVLAFAMCVSIGTGIVLGILPAWSASRMNTVTLMREGGRRGSVGGTSRLRHALIVLNVALALVLLAGTGLLLRSYLYVQGEEKGFAPATLTFRLTADRQVRSAAQMAALSRTSIERIATLPGVLSVGAVSALPLGHSESRSTLRVQGFANDPNQQVSLRRVSGNYFQAMQIRLISGRLIGSDDISTGAVPGAVVVSESFVRHYFPAGNPVGGRVQRGDPGPAWSTIVGVVADVRHSNLEVPPQPTLYEPSWSADSLAVRTAIEPASEVGAIRNAIHQIDPIVLVADVQTMQQRASAASARRRFQATMLTAFSGVAVVLVLMGLYGLLSYSVRQRVPEIGIRIALGGSRGTVVGMVMRQGLLLTIAGLSIGLSVAAVVARAMTGMLYGIRPFDAVTFVLAPCLLLAAAALASLIPALKASRVDPVRSLRQQ